MVGEDTWDAGDRVETRYETSKSPWTTANMVRLISCCTLFLASGKQFRKLSATKAPKVRRSPSSAEAAAAAADVSIVNAFVTVLSPWDVWMCSFPSVA